MPAGAMRLAVVLALVNGVLVNAPMAL